MDSLTEALDALEARVEGLNPTDPPEAFARRLINAAIVADVVMRKQVKINGEPYRLDLVEAALTELIYTAFSAGRRFNFSPQQLLDAETNSD